MPERYKRSPYGHPEEAPRDGAAMKTLFIAFLVATACIGIASTLWCYSCEHMEKLEDCMDGAHCKESDKYCIIESVMDNYGRDEGFTFRCSPNCPGVYESIRNLRHIVMCCDTDECNMVPPEEPENTTRWMKVKSSS